MSIVFNGLDIVDKAFYGFKLNLKTGHLDIEVINDSITPVVLPEEELVNAEDYRHWLWSNDTLQFEFNNKGHLLMRIL